MYRGSFGTYSMCELLLLLSVFEWALDLDFGFLGGIGGPSSCRVDPCRRGGIRGPAGFESFEDEFKGGSRGKTKILPPGFDGLEVWGPPPFGTRGGRGGPSSFGIGDGSKIKIASFIKTSLATDIIDVTSTFFQKFGEFCRDGIKPMKIQNSYFRSNFAARRPIRNQTVDWQKLGTRILAEYTGQYKMVQKACEGCILHVRTYAYAF